MLFLELYRFFCFGIASLLAYQAVLILYCRDSGKPSSNRNLGLLCISSMGYAITCLIGTFGTEFLGFRQESWAIAPLFGVLSFYFYIKVMCQYLDLKLPKSQKFASLFFGALCILLISAYVEKAFFSGSFLSQTVDNTVTSVYRLQVGETYTTNSKITKACLGVLSILNLVFSSIFFYKSFAKKSYIVLAGVGVNFLVISNDVWFALSPSFYLVPLSFSAYFVETAYFTLLLIREMHLKRIELEEDYFEAGKAAELGTMVAQICHDIRNPLALIEGHTLNLLKVNDETTPNQRIHTKGHKVLDATKRINKIVNDYLVMMRTDNETEKEECRISNLVEEAVEICSAKLMKSSIYKIDIQIDSEISMLCHKSRLTMAFTNLISNSIDAIQGLESRWIRIHANTKADKIVIYFEDSGEGIPQETVSKLFERKYTTKKAGDGTGLGLRFVKKVVEGYTGAIHVDQKSKNTCFIITFNRPKEKFHEEAA